MGIITGLVGSCCASLTCSACGKMGSGLSHVTRLCYGIFLLLATLASLLLLTDTISNFLKEKLASYWFGKFIGDGDTTVTADLVGAISVYRVMTGAVIFHLLLAFCLIGVKNSTDTRAKIQNSGVCLKFSLYIALIVAMFFLPSGLFDTLAGWPFKVGGALFILVQLVFLVSFSFDLREGLETLAEEQAEAGQDERKCIWANWLLLFITVGGYAFSFTVFGLLVALNNRKDNTHDGCTSAVVAGSVSIILMIIVSLLSVSEHVRGATNGPGQLNGVFQASMISAYACYQVLSAFVNHPDDSCHMFEGSHTGWVKVCGLLFTFVAVLWSAIRSGSNAFFESRTDDIESDATKPLASEDAEGEKLVEGTKHTEDEAVAVQYSYSQFHIMFALASMYIANILTRWGEIDLHKDEQDQLDLRDSQLSVYLKIGGSVLCFLFYMWIMLAPPCFPDRDFNA